jgi:hypothetical protein
MEALGAAPLWHCERNLIATAVNLTEKTNQSKKRQRKRAAPN